MRTQVSREIGEAVIAKRLNGPYDGCGIDVIVLGERARRQKIGVFGMIQDLADQTLAAGAEVRFRFSYAFFERCRPRLFAQGLTVGPRSPVVPPGAVRIDVPSSSHGLAPVRAV